MTDSNTTQGCRIKRYMFDGGVICMNNRAVLITFQKQNITKTIVVQSEKWIDFKACIRNLMECHAKVTTMNVLEESIFSADRENLLTFDDSSDHLLTIH